MKSSYLLGGIAGLLLLVGAGCVPTATPVQDDNMKKEEQPPVEETLSIGWMGPLSGEAATYGESIRKGVELAQQERGDDINIIFEDSKCDPKETANVTTRLVNTEKVPAIIGEVCSSATLAAAPIVDENKVLLISSASTNPDITDEPWVFRTVPSDALQSKFAAQLLADREYTRIAVLYSNEDYGSGFEQALQEEVPEVGGEIVASEAFERGTTDLRTQLTKIKAATPDAIFIISNSPDAAAAALKQIKELGIEAAIFGSEGLKSTDILEAAGDAADGLVVSSVTAGTDAFAQKYKELFGTEPGPFAAQAYDAYMVLADVIENGAQTGEEIRQALMDLDYQNGATGSLDFDENGDIEGNYDVFEVQDGAFVHVK